MRGISRARVWLRRVPGFVVVGKLHPKPPVVADVHGAHPISVLGVKREWGRLRANLLRGGVAGLLGTAAMTLAITAGRAAWTLRTPPPAEITSKVEAKVGVRERLPAPVFTASWVAAHFTYGTAWGAIYALLRPLLPRSPAAAGALFGGALWAISYLGLMPALRLYPRPKEDYPWRAATMIAAHAVYGVTTSEIERRV